MISLLSVAHSSIIIHELYELPFDSFSVNELVYTIIISISLRDKANLKNWSWYALLKEFLKSIPVRPGHSIQPICFLFLFFIIIYFFIFL